MRCFIKKIIEWWARLKNIYETFLAFLIPYVSSERTLVLHNSIEQKQPGQNVTLISTKVDFSFSFSYLYAIVQACFHKHLCTVIFKTKNHEIH